MKTRFPIALAIVACAATFSIPASAPAATLPLPCVDTGILPAIGDCPAPAPSQCANADLLPTPDNLVLIRKATMCLLNVERRSRGLRALKSNPTLRKVAERYSQTMVDQNFFAHVTPSGGTLMDRINVTRYLRNANDYVIGENLAWGTSTLSTPAAIMNAWMHSDGHRHNILYKGFREIGIGIVTGAPQQVDEGEGAGATYTTEFGRRTR
jgi:uncharacterized protein YkwD